MTTIGFTFRKLADTGSGQRIKKFDPETGTPKLVNPATPGEEHEPWPLKGVEFVGGPPQKARVPTKIIQQAVQEGWAKRIHQTAVVRPAGPNMDTWEGNDGRPHTFIHCEEIHFKMMDGVHRYRVVKQPDKYVVQNDETIMTPEAFEAGDTYVFWNYDVEYING